MPLYRSVSVATAAQAHASPTTVYGASPATGIAPAGALDNTKSAPVRLEHFLKGVFCSPERCGRAAQTART